MRVRGAVLSAIVLLGCGLPKTARVVAPIAASQVVAPPSQPARAPAAASELVIYDPNVHSSPRVKMLVGPDRLPREESHRVLDTLFGSGKYLTDAKQCKGSGETLEQSRLLLDFAPHVFETATGSFTLPGSSQTLYLVATGECGASHADNFGSMMLAVFDGDNVVVRARISGASSIRDVVDLEGDGVEEIVLTSGTTNMGSVIELVSLVRFGRGRLVTVKDFDKVYEDDCEDSTSAKRTREYHVIRALVRPGAPTEFRNQYVKERCR
jgi:hypothetical protein